MPETIYHVYTHANGFENLFNDDENYRFFLKKYAHHIYPIAETYAYCLMPNHLHLMIRIRSEKDILEFLRLKNLNKDAELENQVVDEKQSLEEISAIISKQFSNLLNCYTQAFNKMYGRKGSLFIPRFKRKEVNDENYMTDLIAYIHNNPVHHGFVKQINEWPHSSFHTYLSDGQTNLNKKYMYDWFGNKDQFVQFHKLSKIPFKLVFEE